LVDDRIVYKFTDIVNNGISDFKQELWDDDVAILRALGCSISSHHSTA